MFDSIDHKIVSQHFYVVKIILSAMTHFYVQDNSIVLSAEMSYHCFLILTCRRNSDNIVQSVRSTYTPIFSIFQKIVVNIMFSKQKPLSNERPDNFTFYRGIHDFTVFKNFMLLFSFLRKFCEMATTA